MNDDRFAIGGNQPPEPTPIERGAELVAAANLWSADVPKIADAEQAGRAQALVDQLRLATADVEAAQKAERKPHDDAIVEIRARYRPSLELLGIALDRLKWLAGGWLDRERARLEHEAAERKRIAADAEIAARQAREQAAKAGATVEAEAEARRIEEEAEALRAAALKPVERAAIKGELSARAMSMRTTWRAVITDETKALRHYAKHPAIREAALAAIVKLATAHAKTCKDESKAPPGVRFEREEKAA
jgi:multidrug efflux pump subunit AcrA (membrane-fusion protein)